MSQQLLSRSQALLELQRQPMPGLFELTLLSCGRIYSSTTWLNLVTVMKQNQNARMALIRSSGILRDIFTQGYIHKTLAVTNGA